VSSIYAVATVSCVWRARGFCSQPPHARSLFLEGTTCSQGHESLGSTTCSKQLHSYFK